MRAKLKINYLGKYAEICGKKQEEISLSADIGQADIELKDFLKKTYNISQPYMLLLGNQHIIGAVKKRANIPLKDGEELHLIPLISGG